MAKPDRLIIHNDEQLREYGIFTAENVDKSDDAEPVLTRQDFRDVQEEVLDTYPTDDVFLRTITAAVELGSDNNLARSWDIVEQPRAYVNDRRPSQPDFLVPVSTAAEVYSQSRFRGGVLHELNLPETVKTKITIIREALARKSLNPVMSIADYERPMRVSGGIFASPRWLGRSVQASPNALTLADFKRHAGRLRINGVISEEAFRQLGVSLLDETRSDHPAAHAYVSRNYFNDQSSYRIGASDSVLWFDIIAAYRAITGGADLMPDGSSIAHKAIMSKVPGSWFINGRFIPPPQESDFDF